MLPRFLRHLRVSRYRICIGNPAVGIPGIHRGFATVSYGVRHLVPDSNMARPVWSRL